MTLARTWNLLVCGVAFLAALASVSTAAQPDPNKVLRYAFEVAESSFDPQKNSDVYSGIVNNAIFDAPLRYDFLARPPKLITISIAFPCQLAGFRGKSSRQ